MKTAGISFLPGEAIHIQRKAGNVMETNIENNEFDFIRNFNIFYFNLVKEVKRYRMNKQEFYLTIANKAVAEGMKGENIAIIDTVFRIYVDTVFGIYD
jgi:hypothetical protein